MIFVPIIGRRAFMAATLATLAARGATAARAQGDAGPDAPIMALNDALTAVMRAGSRVPFATRFEQLAPAVDRAFDLPAILRACVGPRWSALPEGEQAELMAVFRRFTIASYVANFDEQNGERFTIEPGGRNSGSDQIIQTSIVPATGKPTRIDYVMRQTPQGWRAVDVLLDGSISRVAVQRSDFRSLIDSGAAPLIASLRRKVSDLSGGAIAS